MVDAGSRYRDTQIFTIIEGDGKVVRYLGRRFPPAPMVAGSPVIVTDGQRPDLIAARMLGDPLAFWRIAEANAVLDPSDLTAVPGRQIGMPAPGAAG